MTMNTRLASMSLLAALLLGGCAAEPTMTERHFGEAVRQTIRAQTYDQSTLSSPSEATVERTDGQMLEAALEAYRGTVANPANVGQGVTINIGEGQQQ